ncbi:conserved hypothetical protein [Theileria equi strain WA]|uniref:NOT2/NOT3/NOT5 C-terminal domain-containing protein n=1 Tax=Theileria equi strain WA TaxID=1537102 RepID=L1LEA0_THEEQ|nr:conserved hypothetical protein [Theileria equi strain WA]EKX73580.1 conserved hypothetical protein [Theileria equi strain WA]|eukprot:XP_004833032.1 conserved hypothetical protein [Theileria equi strain WA]
MSGLVYPMEKLCLPGQGEFPYPEPTQEVKRDPAVSEAKEQKLRRILEKSEAMFRAEPPNPYAPINSAKVPSIFPQEPLSHYATPTQFSRMSEGTLFFIFYFLPGTIQQQFAAQELRKLSWRFHTKLLLWFRRYGEPFKVTETFEQGSFYCFEIEEWKKVVRPDFTFYYSFLEE